MLLCLFLLLSSLLNSDFTIFTFMYSVKYLGNKLGSSKIGQIGKNALAAEFLTGANSLQVIGNWIVIAVIYIVIVVALKKFLKGRYFAKKILQKFIQKIFPWTLKLPFNSKFSESTYFFFLLIISHGSISQLYVTLLIYCKYWFT